MVQQETDEADVWLLPIVLQAVGRQAEADEALKAQIEHWAITAAFYVARPMRIAAIMISQSNGSNEPTSRRILGLPNIRRASV